MAENRNITWNVTLKVDPKVTTRYALSQTSASFEDGKWVWPPPAQLGPESAMCFKACGNSCTAYGTEGQVVFQSGDSVDHPTMFTFKWLISYSKANSGGVFITNAGNGNYRVEGGAVPVSGNSVSVDVIITQIGPTV